MGFLGDLGFFFFFNFLKVPFDSLGFLNFFFLFFIFYLNKICHGGGYEYFMLVLFLMSKTFNKAMVIHRGNVFSIGSCKNHYYWHDQLSLQTFPSTSNISVFVFLEGFNTR